MVVNCLQIGSQRTAHRFAHLYRRRRWVAQRNLGLPDRRSSRQYVRHGIDRRSHDNGTIFRVTPSGGFTVVHTFPLALTTAWARNLPFCAIRSPASCTARTFGGGSGGDNGTAPCSPCPKPESQATSWCTVSALATEPTARERCDRWCGESLWHRGQGGTSNCGVAFR